MSGRPTCSAAGAGTTGRSKVSSSSSDVHRTTLPGWRADRAMQPAGCEMLPAPTGARRTHFNNMPKEESDFTPLTPSPAPLTDSRPNLTPTSPVCPHLLSQRSQIIRVVALHQAHTSFHTQPRPIAQTERLKSACSSQSAHRPRAAPLTACFERSSFASSSASSSRSGKDSVVAWQIERSAK